MNLDRIIKDIRGNDMKMSFPSQHEDASKPETARNVILNCLAVYPVKNRKEIFLVSALATKIVNNANLIDEADKSLILAALDEGAYRKDEGGKTAGVYMAGVIAQVMEELGITS